MRRTGSIAVLTALLSAACGGTTTPTPPDPGAPQIVCPVAPAAVQAPDGAGAIVTFGTPTVTLGTTPLTGPSCNPSSGSRFIPGVTQVTCTVTDAKSRSASCGFSVTVQPPPAAPQLTATRYVAFGDSMTAGEVVSEGYGVPACFSGASSLAPATFKLLQIDLNAAYPTALRQMLASRYTSQSSTVQNLGCQGESTSQGLSRLPGALSSAVQPEVLALLEGANDIVAGAGAIQAAARNLETMIVFAKGRGLRVIVGTLPPQNAVAPTGTGESCVARNGGAPYVLPYNDLVKSVAAGQNVLLADVYQAFAGEVSTLIDCDGLHPTPAGYRRIADAFFNVITKNFERIGTTTFGAR